jgi:hypothetical protein
VREKIGITALKGVSFLFEDDIYDLAHWLLKMNGAKDKGTNCRSRHTVYGLTAVYSMVADVSRDEIVNILESHGLPLGATVEYDNDIT